VGEKQKRLILGVVVPLLALQSCGKEEPGRKQSAEEVAEEMSSLKIEPGQWEATNEILSASAKGLPDSALEQMTGKKDTVRDCITPEQAERPSANFLAAQKNMDCAYRDFSMQGGRMKGAMTCTGPQMPGQVVMEMDGEYGPRSYAMNMDMNASNLPGGMTMTIKAKTTGRRIGECDTGSADR
jgi:hypothetical protein